MIFFARYPTAMRSVSCEIYLAGCQGSSAHAHLGCGNCLSSHTLIMLVVCESFAVLLRADSLRSVPFFSAR